MNIFNIDYQYYNSEDLLLHLLKGLVPSVRYRWVLRLQQSTTSDGHREYRPQVLAHTGKSTAVLLR